jgi:YrbI family 3-deoxy-D-manno-octulosonate 8-phosphate phosphatase
MFLYKTYYNNSDVLQTMKNKLKKIKIVITDVDGVLTDGGMYYSKEGDVMKRFHTRDGMGVTLLRKCNIPTIIVTKEKNNIIKKWSTKMKIKKLYDGILDKGEILTEICKEFGVNADQVLYIGDDVNDVSLLKKVGFSVTPADGIDKVKEICDYVCKNKGGQAAFREVVDMVLNVKSNKSLEIN